VIAEATVLLTVKPVAADIAPDTPSDAAIPGAAKGTATAATVAITLVIPPPPPCIVGLSGCKVISLHFLIETASGFNSVDI
jgi:hypothetical protein